jgi:hypothetical protein
VFELEWLSSDDLPDPVAGERLQRVQTKAVQALGPLLPHNTKIQIEIEDNCTRRDPYKNAFRVLITNAVFEHNSAGCMGDFVTKLVMPLLGPDPQTWVNTSIYVPEWKALLPGCCHRGEDGKDTVPLSELERMRTTFTSVPAKATLVTEAMVKKHASDRPARQARARPKPARHEEIIKLLPAHVVQNREYVNPDGVALSREALRLVRTCGGADRLSNFRTWVKAGTGTDLQVLVARCVQVMMTLVGRGRVDLSKVTGARLERGWEMEFQVVKEAYGWIEERWETVQLRVLRSTPRIPVMEDAWTWVSLLNLATQAQLGLVCGSFEADGTVLVTPASFWKKMDIDMPVLTTWLRSDERKDMEDDDMSDEGEEEENEGRLMSRMMSFVGFGDGMQSTNGITYQTMKLAMAEAPNFSEGDIAEGKKFFRLDITGWNVRDLKEVKRQLQMVMKRSGQCTVVMKKQRARDTRKYEWALGRKATPR